MLLVSLGRNGSAGNTSKSFLPDLAGGWDADLDQARPYLVRELGLLVHVSLALIDRGPSPILKRQVILVANLVHGPCNLVRITRRILENPLT